MAKKAILLGGLILGWFLFAPAPVAHAAATPSVTITSPSATVKGRVTITAAATPSDSATLSYAGLTISGISNPQAALNNYGRDYANRTFGTGVADSAWQTNSTNYSFVFDTTSWPTGTYTLTVYTMDSNGRDGQSQDFSIVIPALPKFVLSYIGTDSQGTSSFRALLSGAQNIGKGKLLLENSSSKEGPWVQVAQFADSNNVLAAKANIQAGTYLRLNFSGEPTLLDVTTNPFLLQITPKISCTFSSSAKTNAKVTGKCLSNVDLKGVTVRLQTNIGKGWTTVAQAAIQGTSFPISVSSKTRGTLQVVISSNGSPGLYSAFKSNNSKIVIR